MVFMLSLPNYINKTKLNKTKHKDHRLSKDNLSVKLTDASSELADFDQSLKNEREVSSEGKAEESQKSGWTVENSSSREKPVQSVSHQTRSGSDNGQSDQRSELSIFLITLHAPLSTVLKRTLDNALSLRSYQQPTTVVRSRAGRSVLRSDDSRPSSSLRSEEPFLKIARREVRPKLGLSNVNLLIKLLVAICRSQEPLFSRNSNTTSLTRYRSRRKDFTYCLITWIYQNIEMDNYYENNSIKCYNITKSFIRTSFLHFISYFERVVQES